MRIERILTISLLTPDTAYNFRPRYVSTHTRANFVRILLVFSAVLSIASILISLLEFFFPNLAPTGDEITEPEVIAVALLKLGLAVIDVAVYIATIVVFLMWLYRSYENLPSFGVRRNTLKYSSGWAVGSFFIPFVSLVIPYRAVKELWNKSVPNSGDLFSDLGPPGFFPLWWAAWLISSFANQMYFRLSWRDELSAQAATMFSIVTSIFDILSAVLAIMVVQEIDRQQIESAKLIPGELESPGPPQPPFPLPLETSKIQNLN